MSLGLLPFLIIVFSGLLALGAMIAAWVGRGAVFKAAMITVALVFLTYTTYVTLAIFAPEFIDARFWTYKAFYQDIAPGMTKEEVFEVLERHYPASGPRQRPKVMKDEPDELGFFMNPETSHEPNCEGIFLVVDHGQVRSKKYVAD